MHQSQENQFFLWPCRREIPWGAGDAHACRLEGVPALPAEPDQEPPLRIRAGDTLRRLIQRTRSTYDPLSLSLSPSHMPCASSIWPSKSCLSSLLVVNEVVNGCWGLGINDIHGLVDPTQPNLERFPDYKKAHGLRCHVQQVPSTRTHLCHFFCRHFRFLLSQVCRTGLTSQLGCPEALPGAVGASGRCAVRAELLAPCGLLPSRHALGGLPKCGDQLLVHCAAYEGGGHGEDALHGGERGPLSLSLRRW